MDRVKQLVGGGVAQLRIMPENDQLAHGHFAAGRAVVVFKHIQDRFPQELQILLRKAGDLAGQVGRDEALCAVQAMCVNDVVCCGAKPLFFLDYIACGKNFPEKIAQIVAGVAEGCVQSGCALIGGETAEHPGMMAPDDYDLAGFTVGIVDKKKIVDGSRLQAGDVLLGVKSSGVHSNGFSLVRKVFGIGAMDMPNVGGDGLVGAAMNLTASVAKMFAQDQAIVNTYYDELGATLGETLLTPTRIYVKPLLAAMEAADIKAVSHITGGGFYENIPRMMKPGLTARVEKASVPVLPIFQLIQKTGAIPERDMFNTFNMGIGLCVAVSKETAQAAADAFAAAGEETVFLGEVVEGDEGVVLC